MKVVSYRDELKEKLEKLLIGLNSEQHQAVVHKDGPVLVIAGAGSGKTRVATLRMAHLIAEGVCPTSILGVTFTNKAAKEMQERVHNLVGSSVLVSTFHSLGARILREFAGRIGYEASFVIYDEADREKCIKSCLRRFYQDGGGLTPEEAVRMLSKVKNQCGNMDMTGFFDFYQQELQKNGAMDFDDLLWRTRQLLLSHSDVLETLQRRWQYILVDEYQDTNDVQSQLVALLAGESKNVFAVGDPDQSIYSWRGANLNNILSFTTHFEAARQIRLEKNYRSTNTILKAANAVISKNRNRLEKSLWSDRGDGAELLCYVGRSERQEAEYVVDGIRSLSRSGGYDLSEIALLYRTNAQSRSFEEELLLSQIPYVIWGGLSFYQRREVKDVMAYARLALMPQDIVAFERVINTPKRGIGAATVEKVTQYASEHSYPIIDLVIGLTASNFDQIQYPGLSLSLTSKQKQGFVQFCDIIKMLRQAISSESAFQLISSAIHDSGYLKSLDEDDEHALERRENLEQLLAKAIEWDQAWEKRRTEPDAAEKSSLTMFFETLALESSVQELMQAGSRVTLATIHNTKGLEFKAVFLVGLEEDILPHINVKYKSGGHAEEDIEEERRLMYVAMTRAKDLLSLSLVQQRMLWGGLRMMRPSRFLYEIPDHYLKKVRAFPMQKSVAAVVEEVPQEFSVGDVVLHPNHGVGMVVAVAASSVGPTYDVRFMTDAVTRKIAGRYTAMKKVSSRS